jgi:uncharacterized OB-fold protein
MSFNETPIPGAATRPDPVFTPDAVFFWEGAARGELLGQRCADCKKITHPPRPMCPACHSVRRETVKLSGRGKIASWVIPRHPAPVGFAEAPIVALIELEEGIRLVSNVIDVGAQDVRGGMAVEVRFAPTRGGKAVPVFAPAPGGARG